MIDIPAIDFADGENIGDVTFGEFKNWFREQLNDTIHSVVVKELGTTVNKEIMVLNNECKNLKAKLTESQNEVVNLRNEIDTIKTFCREQKTVTDNNLKY